MKKLMFLVHRIPYPPNKGDKIRSFNFLKALAKKYRIYLGAFIDDVDDWQYVEELKAWCEETHFITLTPGLAKVKSLQGFFNDEALSLTYYRNQNFQLWVDNILKLENIDRVYILSSVMAQYIKPQHNVELVADFVDVDSDKWLQYSQNQSFPANWIYRREAKKLFEFESKIAKFAKATVFVTAKEAEFFKGLVSGTVDSISYVNNGVDTDFFSPEHHYVSPFHPEENAIVFTGAMDYWANVDAVKWFVEQIFPKILLHNSKIKFYIVGSKPSKEVQMLEAQKGVVVTGRVDDIRPYIAYSKVIVAPLRIARGIQNKVLEAMAMGKHVFATSSAIEGIPITKEHDVTIIDNADIYADKVNHFLADTSQSTQSVSNRSFITNTFSWETNVSKLAELIG